MTNDGMTNDERMTKSKRRPRFLRASSFVLLSSFVIPSFVIYKRILMQRSRVITTLAAVALFTLGALWGSGSLPLMPAAWADVEKLTPETHFLAGGERSEIVLKEIAGIMRQDIVVPLKQMEVRLARIEAIAEGKPVPPPVQPRRGAKGEKH